MPEYSVDHIAAFVEAYRNDEANIHDGDLADEVDADFNFWLDCGFEPGETSDFVAAKLYDALCRELDRQAARVEQDLYEARHNL
jgi:hypothetical protein